MVKKEENSEERDWQKADARILGQILAAQNIVFVLSDTIRIAEFYAQGLISVPGVIFCCVCLGDKSAQAGEADNRICAECEALQRTAGAKGNPFPVNQDFKCNLTGYPDIRAIAIDSCQHHFGFFVFKLGNAAIFDVYQPFISNLANYVAISIENRLQESLLQKAHDELELRVEERTAELKAANERLSRDIAERKKLEEALLLREEQLRNINESLEQRVRVRTTELEQANSSLKTRTEELEMFNKSMIGREKRMIELKEEVNRLCSELGRQPPYPPVWKQ